MWGHAHRHIPKLRAAGTSVLGDHVLCPLIVLGIILQAGPHLHPGGWVCVLWTILSCSVAPEGETETRPGRDWLKMG